MIEHEKEILARRNGPVQSSIHAGMSGGRIVLREARQDQVRTKRVGDLELVQALDEIALRQIGVVRLVAELEAQFAAERGPVDERSDLVEASAVEIADLEHAADAQRSRVGRL